jgi:hypothetical protein
MADVFIALTRPEIVDKDWPPKIEAPVQNDAHEQASFGRAKSMITNDVAGIVAPSNNGKPPEETVSNVEAKIKTTIGAPIANAENFLGIATRGGNHRYPPRDPPKGTPIMGGDSQILHQVGAPISNDGQHATIYQGPETEHPRKIAEPPTSPSSPISNENGVTFSKTNTAKKLAGTEDLKLVATKIAVENSDTTTFAKNEGSISNEIPSTILPINGQQTYPSTDTSIGGGGDQTKLAGAVDVTGIGKPLNA